MANQTATWKQLCVTFANRYDSVTKQNAISNRLMMLRMNDMRGEDDFAYTALYKLPLRTVQLISMM